MTVGVAEGLLATDPNPRLRRRNTCPATPHATQPPTTATVRSPTFRSDPFVHTVCYVIGFFTGNGMYYVAGFVMGLFAGGLLRR